MIYNEVIIWDIIYHLTVLPTFLQGLQSSALSAANNFLLSFICPPPSWVFIVKKIILLFIHLSATS